MTSLVFFGLLKNDINMVIPVKFLSISIPMPLLGVQWHRWLVRGLQCPRSRSIPCDITSSFQILSLFYLASA